MEPKNTIHMEAHLLGFRGRAAAHKFLVMKYNRMIFKLVQNTSTLDHTTAKTGFLESRFNLYCKDGKIWI